MRGRNPLPKIVWIPINDIKIAEFNPPKRTSEQSIEDIVADMRVRGFLTNLPVQIAVNGILGDGHRRVMAARLAGLTEVPGIYTNLELHELYNLNSSHKPHKPSDWLWVYILGGAAAIPAKTLTTISSLEEVVGRAYLKRIARKELSPNLYRMAYKTASVCHDISKEFVSRVIHWMVGQEQQFKLRRALAENVNPRRIINAVEEDKPLY